VAWRVGSPVPLRARPAKMALCCRGGVTGSRRSCQTSIRPAFWHVCGTVPCDWLLIITSGPASLVQAMVAAYHFGGASDPREGSWHSTWCRCARCTCS